MVFVVAAALTALISVSVSKYHIGTFEALGIISNHLNGIEPQTYEEVLKNHIVWEKNVPRAIAGVAVGAILAVGGAVIQTIIRNPITDSYTTGISSGALFGVTIYVILGISILPLAGNTAMIINAFLFALIPAAVVITISIFKKTTPTMMVLIGVAVMYLFTAFTTMLKFSADPDQLEEIYRWNVGTLGEMTWTGVPATVAGMIVILILMMIFSKSFNVMVAGDNAASSLGVNANRVRIFSLIVVSLVTAAAVCFTGTIGFVGLVAPHLSRMFVGSDTKYLIPCSAAAGALMLCASDCLSRVIAPVDLPVGVITALIGSPLFLYFLFRRNKNAW